MEKKSSTLDGKIKTEVHNFSGAIINSFIFLMIWVRAISFFFFFLFFGASEVQRNNVILQHISNNLIITILHPEMSEPQPIFELWRGGFIRDRKIFLSFCYELSQMACLHFGWIGAR